MTMTMNMDNFEAPALNLKRAQAHRERATDGGLCAKEEKREGDSRNFFVIPTPIR